MILKCQKFIIFSAGVGRNQVDNEEERSGDVRYILQVTDDSSEEGVQVSHSFRLNPIKDIQKRLKGILLRLLFWPQTLEDQLNLNTHQKRQFSYKTLFWFQEEQQQGEEQGRRRSDGGGRYFIRRLVREVVESQSAESSTLNSILSMIAGRY